MREIHTNPSIQKKKVRPENEAAKLTYNLVNVWVSAGDIWRCPKIGVPLNHPFDFRIFHYKPSSYWGPTW